MEFRFGMPVVDSGSEEADTLDHVLVTSGTREVSHIVVQSPRVSEDVLLPLSLVRGNVDDRLVLQMTAAELVNMPRSYEGRTTSPPAGRVDIAIVHETAEQRQTLEDALSIRADAREYGAETSVTTADLAEGRLAAVSADQYTNRISELRIGGPRYAELTVPERWVGDLGTDTIALSAPRADLERAVGSPAGPYVHRAAGDPRPRVERDREQDRWRSSRNEGHKRGTERKGVMHGRL